MTHRALCLSSARIWSLGFSPNLLGKDRKKKETIILTLHVWAGEIKHRNVKISVGINDLPTSWTYLSRKSLSTTAEMSSKGFPIPNSVFSLWGDRNILYHPDSHTPDKTNGPLSHRLSYVSNSLDSITETLMRGDHVLHQQHIEKVKQQTPKQWTRTCPITVMTWEKLLFSLHCER